MKKEKFKYYLPHEGSRDEIITSNNSLIIIGANGSGKSKLGAWMEKQNPNNTHRIGAQRSLNFGEYINLKSYEQAKNLLFWGDENSKDKDRRWDWGRSYTTMLLNDYEHALSALIALKNNQNDKYVIDCKAKDELNQQHEKVPETVIDKLKRIWLNVFPHRNIDFYDSKVTASFKNIKLENTIYNGAEMSDGERVGLYLITQCLCLPKETTIIIDEPEIHLHRSIMNRLWAEIEKEREDCFFIYITHDTQFAANHKQTDKIWVKSFDGENWELEKIEDKSSGLPEELLLDIMGNRKKVLFVEGKATSYDTRLYSEIYHDYYVVPCGGCSTVINLTKAMKNTPQLHNLECFGIIDRDYRTDNEIKTLKKNNIYTLDVAEVENLFLVEELLCVVNDILSPEDKSKTSKIISEIIDERYKNQIESQICEAAVAELKYQLSIIGIDNKNEENAIQTFEDAIKDITYEKIKCEIEGKFRKANDYKQILRLFNCKSLACEVEKVFSKDEYQNFVIGQLQGKRAEEIKDAIKNYLPSEIQTV